MTKVRDMLLRMIREQIPVQSRLGKVTAVDESDMSCTVELIDDDVTLYKVRINNIGSKAGFICIPSVNSVVVVSKISNSDQMHYVSMFSETEMIMLNGDQYGGLVKVGDLVGKINAIEQDLNNLKTVFSAWVPAPGDGGTLLKTASAIWAASSITPTAANDIVNNKVKHG